MIYELRIYKALPGQLPRLLNRFRDHTLRIWERHGIKQVGFWTTVIGESERELTYMLAWESLADRETKWGAFQRDPEWQEKRGGSEKDGPIVEGIRNQILAPTNFSALS